ncbi:MAG: 2-oxoglutarate dehydrogenase E1 component [Candidatus Porifericomitaceae bacterium WSBS_2022_MAG_OTU9]
MLAATGNKVGWNEGILSYNLQTMNEILPHSENLAYLESVAEAATGALQVEPASSAKQQPGQDGANQQPSQDTAPPGQGSASQPSAAAQARVLQLINAYRFRGHRQADLDPLRQYERPEVPELDLAYYGFSQSDLDRVYNAGSLYGVESATLGDIFNIVRRTYCHTIGVEYMHIVETSEKRWLQQRLEAPRSPFPEKTRRLNFERLVAAQALENYLHTRYTGQKRFSLEGGESLIPLLSDLVELAGRHKVEEMVIGMAHRGRLNVLVNVLGKSPRELFSEFEGQAALISSSGDVKYHLGYSSDAHIGNHHVHLTLAFNPSHLEIIDPVVEGSVRARQDRRHDSKRDTVLPILLHGDAAFAGQGVVMETFSLSQTKGYATGGTVHIIINNQIGFTTSDPLDSRSTLYCTDIAKMVQAPILHVNGDDPEALLFAGRIALDYRMQFNKDVVIDMVCYRRHGHSEADEPAATQPSMYRHIKQHPTVREICAKRLMADGIISEDDPREIEKDYITALESADDIAANHGSDPNPEQRINFSSYYNKDWRIHADTTISLAGIAALGKKISTVPDNISLHPSVQRIVSARSAMGKGEISADWGFAETLAYASLLDAGYPVRLSGQDSGRGTFFHRHAVWHDQNSDTQYMPLQHLADDQADFLVINSILSEEAILAFEFGYSCAAPESLVVWEAQFGDFANCAQVVFDQFISSCEAKWNRLCGLVMLLPHGYDGQGPEHSSARPERFLQLCAEDNMQVCVPSTAAQIFHLLRRQMLRPLRKPLVVMSPKSLLRHPSASSPLQDFSERGLQLVLEDLKQPEAGGVRRILLCCGKLAHEIMAAPARAEKTDTAIVRIEQLYPFPLQELQQVLTKYRNAESFYWVQEEPENQGMWEFIRSSRALGEFNLGQELQCISRPAAAAPATGAMPLHRQQQREIVEAALAIAQPDMDQ